MTCQKKLTLESFTKVSADGDITAEGGEVVEDGFEGVDDGWEFVVDVFVGDVESEGSVFADCY